jgi:hypothetical protein
MGNSRAGAVKFSNDAVSPPEPPESDLVPAPGVGAWQPLTPGGVAAFAQAPLGRLWLVQLLVALVAALGVGWFLLAAWFPVVRQAIGQLPEAGEIRQQQLQLARVPERVLAQSRHLAVVVDPAGQSAEGTGADLRVRFKNRSVEWCSLLGCLELAYPRRYVIQFNQPELQPWWEAWQPFLLGASALGVVVLLFLLWGAVALLYGPAACLAARLARRALTLGGSVKLAGAALLPGALLLTLGIVLYGEGVLDLIRLAVVAGLHVALGWVYLVAAVASLPAAGVKPLQQENPFAGEPGAPDPADERK